MEPCDRIEQCPCPSLCQGFCMKVEPHAKLGTLDEAIDDAWIGTSMYPVEAPQ